MLLVTNLANTIYADNDETGVKGGGGQLFYGFVDFMQTSLKMAETLAHGYSSESAQ